MSDVAGRVAVAVAAVGWLALVSVGAVVYGAVEAYAACPDTQGHMFVKYIEADCRADHIADTLPWAAAAAVTPFVIVAVVCRCRRVGGDPADGQ